MPKQIVNISDTVKTFQEKVNIISADVGWRGNLTTTEDSDVVGAINEHDAELGTITSVAMGTTASTVSTAILELDTRLDSINDTLINSAKLHMRDSSATNTVKGDLDVHSNVDIGGNLQVDGTLTVDGVVNFKAGTDGSVTLGDGNTDNVVFSADVNSNINPNTDNTYDLGTNTQQWRDLYINGTGYIDAISADTLDVNTSATIATAKIEDLTDNRVVIVGTGGELEDDANFTFDGTTFNLNGNVDVGNGLDVTGSITVTGTVDGRDIAADGTLLDTLDGELGTISAAAMGTTASTVSGAILELETEIDTLNTKVEPSRALDTTATTLAAAINELHTQIDLLDSGATDQIAQIGDLASLDTTAKGDLVAAINELDDRIDTDADFRNKVSASDTGGDGSFTYTQSTGVFTYTGPSASETRAHFSGGTEIGISSGTINHSNVTRTNTTSTDSASYGGTFTVIDSLTSNARGHITAANTKTIALPGAYSHPTFDGDDFSVDTGALTGATVVSDIDINVTTDGNGHVTDANGSVSTRTLTLANLGYTGATDANNYSHPTHPGDDASIDTGALTGATVISDLDFNITTDTLGHVTDANATVATRTLTLANLGYTGATNANNFTYSHPNHTGDVTSSGDGATTIANNAVTNAKIADDAVGANELKSVQSLIIYNSAGTALKTLYGAGS